MDIKLHESWESILNKSIDAAYFKTLSNFVENEYKAKTCFPPENQIFSAFEYCHFKDIKVVIIGQDPYHSQKQANGLCFSVNNNVSHPPSLINIFKEIKTDIGKPYPKSGDLMHWAKQGVLLLNATLTVQEGKAGSHQKQGWEQFTDDVIELISAHKKNIVFLLWGGFAKKKGAKVNTQKHCVLTSGHPSPLSANRGYWFGNSHFSKCNSYLQSNKIAPIIW